MSAKVKAYNIIKERIIKCSYVPGDVISESELIKDLEIGRTPIREALIKLENEDLLKIYPKRGIFISDISFQDIHDIYDMLIILEPIAAKLATRFGDVNVLNELLNTYVGLSEDQYTEVKEADAAFHEYVYNSTRNKILTNYLSDLFQRNTRVRNLSKIVVKERLKNTKKEHMAILKAMLARDEAKAERLMLEHVQNGMRSALQLDRS